MRWSPAAGQRRVKAAWLQSAIARTRARHALPALAVSLTSGTTVWRQKIQGARVCGQPAPALLDDYFHIGSCAKSALAMAAAKLVAQQRIDWQSRLTDCFARDGEQVHPDYRDVTLLDLLLCRRGIAAFTDAAREPLPEFNGDGPAQTAAFVRYLPANPPAAARRDDRFEHLYSNASYALAAAMLQRVDGRDYTARMHGA